MIGKGLFEKIFEAASIQRWNDHARPVEFTELDKQAHKMVIAYVIARFEEQGGGEVSWLDLIEGGIFEFLHRVILTDIKPTVFHKMMERKGRELNEYVLRRLGEDVKNVGGGFDERFERYLFDPEHAPGERRVLQAAHYLATNWEFKIIYHLNPSIYGIERTRGEIENELEDYYDLSGVQKISLGKKSFGFIDLCGQLRFQKRWSGTPRIPATSVLGHMLTVAVLAYFCTLRIGGCPRRLYDNFYGGLFHDLPEVLTRDIISPVKRSVSGIEAIIKEYERMQIEEVLLPLLPRGWRKEILYFVEDEFENKIVKDGRVVSGVSDGDLQSLYNRDEFLPLDGRMIRACDELGACIEANLSIRYGVRSPQLVEAVESLKEKYRGAVISGVDFGSLFGSFGA
jgi:putative hydrolase of HD superfamily